MSIFSSSFAPDINALLEYRDALGYVRQTVQPPLKSLDGFCANKYPEATVLTKEIVIAWLEEQHSNILSKATAARLLGNYLQAIGKEAYILYHGYAKEKKGYPAYIFTDGELAALFSAIDKTEGTNKEPFLPEIAPVIYRLIYTCGLRPNEGRELKCANVNLKTGEILITNTKWKKERIVVMSDDMLAVCKSYDKRRAVFGRDNEYFFPSWEGGQLGTQQLGCYLKDAWERANPDVLPAKLPRIRVYDLRHRFATAALMRWLDAKQPLGAKLPYLRAYMGHSTLSETAYYIHLLPENLVRSAGIDWAAFDEMIPGVVAWEK
jgi:integrase